MSSTTANEDAQVSLELPRAHRIVAISLVAAAVATPSPFARGAGLRNARARMRIKTLVETYHKNNNMYCCTVTWF